MKPMKLSAGMLGLGRDPRPKKKNGLFELDLCKQYIYIFICIYMVLKRCDTPIYHHIPIYTYIYTYTYTYTAILFWRIKGLDMHILGQAISDKHAHKPTQKLYCTSGRLHVLETCYSKIYL